MSKDNKSRLDLDELRKSLQELEFSETEIQEVLEKAEAENKLLDDDDSITKGCDAEKGKVTDKDVADPAELEKEEMKKAYDEIMYKKTDLDKSISDYCDKFGNVPGFTKPDDFFTSKSLDVNIEKGFTAQNDLFEKAFAGVEALKITVMEQVEINKGITDSLNKIQKSVEEIANTPNPLKGLFGSYQNKVVEKGGKDGDVDVISLRDRGAAINAFEKSLDKIENEEDKNAVRSLISTFTINKTVNDKALNIVKKALKVDFEK